MVTDLRHRLEQEKGKHSQISASLAGLQADLVGLARSQKDIERATWILQHVVSETQATLTFYIANPVTAALAAIFPDPYDFVVECTQARGKTEVRFWLKREGLTVSSDPDDSVGGGVINTVAFALRVSLFSLGQRMGKKTRPVIFFDEPFAFVHGTQNLSRISELLKAVSQEVGIQIIAISGEEESSELIAQADRVFYVQKKNGESVVEVQDGA